MERTMCLLLLGLAVVTALPHDPVIGNLDLFSDNADHWEKDYIAPRYNAETDNVYHLFTRDNPSVSQPLLIGTDLSSTNYNSSKRTGCLIHGWQNTVTSDFNTVMVPAFLAAEDMNVIAVDWSAGASTSNYSEAVTYTPLSGQAVASFIAWLVDTTGGSLDNFHIVGHSLGGQQAGIVGRNLDGAVAYITALDPAYPEWSTNNETLRSTDGVYTEAIHTNAGVLGFESNLCDCDFYPNKGINMPGCNSLTCDHARSFYYMAESLISGGFTGTGCESYEEALAGNCTLTDTLNMGGITPKTGESGIFYLETNAAPPFSLG